MIRQTAHRARRWLVRKLHGAALAISSPFDYLTAVQARLHEPKMRHYLAEQGGADALLAEFYVVMREDGALRRHMAQAGSDKLLGWFYDVALGDEALRARIVRSEVGDVFRRIYSRALADPAARGFLAEGGIDALHRHVFDMARACSLPLAEEVASFGQESEDLILTRMFDRRTTGFYVDVGAHHPFRFSNTYLLYRRGWRGINIDAMPGAMDAFRRWRPEDVNLECLVSSDTAPRIFFQYDEPALNTVSEDLVRKREVEAPHYRLVGQVRLEARRLADILADYVPPGRDIDILNVDVEGHDLDVLASNDWQRFRPKVIVAELIGTDFAEMEASPLYRFLADRGYRLQSKLVNSAIFVS
jgi:FkbM family methyltransferase